ncbi:MAG: GNAT family N-acetyltransferase [Myxococcota bacterium]
MTTSSPVTLRTPRLSLTLPAPSRAQRLADYFVVNRDHLSPWEPPFPDGVFSERFWRRRLEHNRQEYHAGRSLRLVLSLRDDPEGRVVGMANFTQFVRGALMGCTLGYSLEAASQGRGLMFEALDAALTHVFTETRMHRVMANYLPTNERSGRLLKRLGFTVEGYARDYIFINGAWRDHILTSRLNDVAGAATPDYLATTPTAAPSREEPR